LLRIRAWMTCSANLAPGLLVEAGKEGIAGDEYRPLHQRGMFMQQRRQRFLRTRALGIGKLPPGRAAAIEQCVAECVMPLLQRGERRRCVAQVDELMRDAVCIKPFACLPAGVAVLQPVDFHASSPADLSSALM